MPTSFHNVLLDVYYSDFANGGPEWATAVIRSGEGGPIGHRAQSAEDFRSRYEIEFAEIEKDRQVGLYNFAVLRRGMANAFRFLAPDSNVLEGEPVARYNSTTGNLEVVTETNGTDTVFYLCRYFQDITNDYIKRICCPSPLDQFRLELAFAVSPDDLQVVDLVPGGESLGYPLYGEGLYGEDLGSTTIIVLDFNTGILTCSPALPAGLTIKTFGVHHWPACFASDWHKAGIDYAAIGKLSVGLEEQLPIELGILI